ncbi:MAG: Franean1_4349 family RiPP [Acidobacteria bacterium]|nr:Franean1_4349 family RiPP [Acidobacteriota bacterium]
MSQRSVERVIGRLVTDEAFRRRFAEEPLAALREAIECGAELTSLELQALVSIDAQLVDRIASAIDPRLLKIGTCGGRS